MAAHKVRPSKSKAGKPGSLEWIGGHFPVPGVVMDDAEPYHSELVIWFELPRGVVVGDRLVRAGRLAGALGASLRDCMAKPLVGPPRRPGRVRVATEAGAAEVRGVVGPETEVVVGATPELDDVAAAIQEQARQWLASPDGEGEATFRDFTSGSYLQGGLVQPESIENLFRASRILNAMAPWKAIDDQQVIRLDIPALDVHGAVVSILGGAKQSFGFAIFPDHDGFEAMVQKFEDNDGQVAAPDTPMLSLEFRRLGELPEPARREAKRFAPPSKQTRYPWVELRECDGSMVPVDRRNIEIATAVAWTLGTFCARNAAAVAGRSAEPVSMSIETSDVATVRYTLPYESFDEFESEPHSKHRPGRSPRTRLRPPSSLGKVTRDERAEAPSAPPTARPGGRAAKVGRNEPCPCGSGRKYKYCHLRADESSATSPSPAPLSSGTVAGVEMIEILRSFADECYGDQWRRHTRDFRDAKAAAQLVREWSVFHFEVDGETAADAFATGLHARLTTLERQWFAAQREAWLSVWEVLAVERGHGFTARDLLSGEERTVRDANASESLKARDAFLGRVVQWGGGFELWGVHPRTLPPRAASHVVGAARKQLRLGSRGLAPREDLRATSTGRFLIRRWESAVERVDWEIRNPPRLATTDGETLVMCSVVHDFDPAARAHVASALAAMPQVVPPDAGEMQAEHEWTYTFYRVVPEPSAPGRGPDRQSVLGEARLGKSELRLETNSRERCEFLTGLVSAAAGPWLRERERSEEDVRELYLQRLGDPAAVAKGRRPEPEAVPPQELIERMQALKRDHYARWLDESIPALGGKTPREAARLLRGRRELDLLLRDMENRENRRPEWDRFDFSELREELGLEP